MLKSYFIQAGRKSRNETSRYTGVRLQADRITEANHQRVTEHSANCRRPWGYCVLHFWTNEPVIINISVILGIK